MKFYLPSLCVLFIIVSISLCDPWTLKEVFYGTIPAPDSTSPLNKQFKFETDGHLVEVGEGTNNPVNLLSVSVMSYPDMEHCGVSAREIYEDWEQKKVEGDVTFFLKKTDCQQMTDILTKWKNENKFSYAITEWLTKNELEGILGKSYVPPSNFKEIKEENHLDECYSSHLYVDQTGTAAVELLYYAGSEYCSGRTGAQKIPELWDPKKAPISISIKSLFKGQIRDIQEEILTPFLKTQLAGIKQFAYATLKKHRIKKLKN
jgi:hypothetical protein